ncbi:MAG: lysine--tRNA ligase, partial [Chloroflexi bacterium]|nr:lysine--tRNA ligase [Chloroflexota bacterium]
MALEVDELRSRMAKLASLEEAGVAPYPHRYHRTCLASQAVANFDQLSQTQELIHIAGRLMSFRAMGRASFAHLTDSSGRIQVHFREDVLGPDVYQGLKRLDLGDVVGVEGTLFRTRTGEITVEARQVVLLAKALRSPPEKWHGLVDVEKRYRQRYLD